MTSRENRGCTLVRISISSALSSTCPRPRGRSWGAGSGSLALAATLAAVLLVQPKGGERGRLYAELSQAKQQSATLEDSLQQYDIDGCVLSGHAAALVAELEDRISAIDGSL